MSITDAIKDMEKQMGADFSDYMNEPLPHSGQAYIQRDYKTGTDYICCPFCGKKNFPLTPGAKIQGRRFKCCSKQCANEFEVNC